MALFFSFLPSGLRLMPQSEPNCKKARNSAEYSREYREQVKKDPLRYKLYRQTNMEKCRRYYHRPRSESEKADQREKARMRMKLYRYICIHIRPKKKIGLFPVSRPTLFFGADPKLFFQLSKEN